MTRFWLLAWLTTSSVSAASSGVYLLWLASNTPTPGLVPAFAALVCLFFVSSAVAVGRIRAANRDVEE